MRPVATFKLSLRPYYAVARRFALACVCAAVASGAFWVSNSRIRSFASPQNFDSSSQTGLSPIQPYTLGPVTGENLPPNAKARVKQRRVVAVPATTRAMPAIESQLNEQLEVSTREKLSAAVPLLHDEMRERELRSLQAPVQGPTTVADRQERASRALEQSLRTIPLAIHPNSDFEAAFAAAGRNTTSDLGGIGSKATLAHLAGSGLVGSSLGFAARSVRLGEITVRTEALVEHLEPSKAIGPTNRYDAVSLRSSITVPALGHPLRLSVGGGYGHLLQQHGEQTQDGLGVPSGDGLSRNSSDATLLSSPALNASSRLNLTHAEYSASASVPVVSHVDVGVGFRQQQVSGGVGLAESGSLQERQQLYTGAVTYAPGGGRSSISLVGRALHAVDTLAPNVDTNVRRGDLLFSVKF